MTNAPPVEHTVPAPPAPSAPLGLAIDVGGTKVAVGLVDERGQILSQRSIPTRVLSAEHEDNPAAALAARIAALAEQVIAATLPPGVRPRAAAVGTTGHVDARRGVILHSGLVPGWSGFALGPVLSHHLGMPVRILNDGHAMAVAEHRIGAAKGTRHALCVAVGTGVGGGFIHDGQLYLGARGLAGLIGHTTIAFAGRRCQCGKRGCLEAYAAGPRLVDEYHRLRRSARRRLGRAGSAAIADEASAVRGSDGADGADDADAIDGAGDPSQVGTLQEVVARAAAGDAVAGLAIERGGEYLGAGLASLANALNPEVIVVGGGVLGAGARWLEAVRWTVAARTRHTVVEGLRVVPAALGPEAVLAGAGLASFEVG